MTNPQNELLSREKWTSILKIVRQAAATARKRKDNRAELPADVLLEIEHALELGLKGLPLPALEEKNPDDFRPREIYRIDHKDEVVAHIIAAREKLIDDQRPNATAREFLEKQHGLIRTPERIRQWVRQYEKRPGQWVSFQLESARRVPEYSALIDLRRR